MHGRYRSPCLVKRANLMNIRCCGGGKKSVPFLKVLIATLILGLNCIHTHSHVYRSQESVGQQRFSFFKLRDVVSWYETFKSHFGNLSCS